MQHQCLEMVSLFPQRKKCHPSLRGVCRSVSRVPVELAPHCCAESPKCRDDAAAMGGHVQPTVVVQTRGFTASDSSRHSMNPISAKKLLSFQSLTGRCFARASSVYSPTVNCVGPGLIAAELPSESSSQPWHCSGCPPLHRASATVRGDLAPTRS